MECACLTLCCSYDYKFTGLFQRFYNDGELEMKKPPPSSPTAAAAAPDTVYENPMYGGGGEMEFTGEGLKFSKAKSDSAELKGVVLEETRA